MESLIALATDFYWEQDTAGRFTLIRRTGPHDCLAAIDLDPALGKAPWELARLKPETGDWMALQETMGRRDIFRDLDWTWRPGTANACVLRVSGEPVFDADGKFSGYRGVMRDITAQKRDEGALRRFRQAMDVSGDPIYVVDRSAMRITEVNETAVRTSGYTREELLQMGPHDLLLADRELIEREFDEVIAAGRKAVVKETVARHRDGSTYIYELQRRAIRFEDRWFIVTIARDISRRRHAETNALRFSQMYAAIMGTNEAILHARNAQELYQRVCDVAVGRGQIILASVLLHEPGTEWATVAAVAGIGSETIRTLHISFDERKPEGRGIVGTAFRNRKPCVINDFPNDPRVRLWRQAQQKDGAAAGAAIPLLRDGAPIGVLALYASEKGAFDNEIIQLLERMAQNIGFALANFDREAERQRAVHALRESEEKYRRILENMSDGYFEVDLKGNYIAVNEAMCRMHHCTREEALRLNYRDFMDAHTAEEVFRSYNAAYLSGERAELSEHRVRRHDGTEAIVQTAMQVIVDADGVPIGFSGVSRDVTSRSAAEEALRASEEKYRSILESIEEAYYEVDLAGNMLLCNQAFCRMFGFDMSEVIGISYRNYHTPAEAAYVYAHFNEVFRTGRPKTGIDWRLLRKDGATVLCEGSIHVIHDAYGKPVGFRGMLRDVTARREMEAALRESEERFRDLTELSSDWYWEQDNRYRFVQISGDVHGRTGMSAEDFLGKTLWEMPFDNMTVEQWIDHQGVLSEGKAFSELVLRTPPFDGQVRYISISGLPIHDTDGRFSGYRGTGKDITERKLAEERIRHLATHDILTGLPNRMLFSQTLGYTLQQGRRYGRKFAVMYIDLDHFKTVNDTLGHDAGDVLLREMAKRLADSVRASDFVARLAGDEFVVIVQEAGDAPELNLVAEKILAALRAPVTLAGAPWCITASIGISVFPDDGDDEDTLLKRADAAMYRIKHGSKDSFLVYLP